MALVSCQEYTHCDTMYKDEIKTRKIEVERLQKKCDKSNDKLEKYFIQQRIKLLQREIDYFTKKMLR
ncbi:MAG: hypothetical protein M0R17_07010 [Candidatus Omnitrophica bacterium]|nr:hypothetical protein [Candidatus Omnitrophota bacterium]